MNWNHLLKIAQGSVLLALTILVGCGATHEQPGTDGNTHWLRACSLDADCGAGLSCLCGSCSVECEQDATCSMFGATASCAASTAECGSTSTLQCVAQCSSDGDCPEDGLRCDQGQCVQPPSPAGCHGQDDCEDGFACEGGQCVALSFPGRGECDAMDARPSGDDCALLLGYAWDGSDCNAVECGCVGEDCDGLYEKRGECLNQYAHCDAGGPYAYCDSAADCGEGEGCFWGTCGPNCDDYLECGEERGCYVEEVESCVPSVLDVGSPETGQCLPRCRTDDDCAAVASGLRCWISACVRVLPECELRCPKVADSCPQGCTEISSRPYHVEEMCVEDDFSVRGCILEGRSSTTDARCAVSPDGRLHQLSGTFATQLIIHGGYRECTAEEFDIFSDWPLPACQ